MGAIREAPGKALGEALRAAAPRAPLPLDPGTLDRLARYAELLVEWNARTNLIGTTEPARLVEELLLDSLQLAPLLPPAAFVVDIGTGAGLPIVPLFLARPDLTGWAVEPRRKRVAFLNIARRELNLPQLRVIEGSVLPDGRLTLTHGAPADPPRPFDAALSRAVFAPPEWLALGAQLVVPGGHVLAALNGDATVAHDLAADLDPTLLGAPTVVAYTIGDKRRAILRVTRPPVG